MNYTIHLTAQQMQYIIGMLGRCPFAEVADLIASLKIQVEGQQGPREVANLERDVQK